MESEEFIGRVIRYLSWKVDYSRRHGLLSVRLLGDDLKYITQLLDKRSNIREEHSNILVYETLACLQKGVMPVLS